MTDALDASAISVRYGGNLAVDGVDVVVPAGRMIGVIGANGAGKSTLVNALAGWSRGRPAVRGTVRLAGEPMDGLPPHRRAARGLVLVPEGKGIFADLTVAENLALVRPPADVTGRHLFSMEEICGLFPRLAERREHKGGMLSGGERQMVAVSRALRAAPRVLLLDEPSAGLAPRLVYELLATMRTLVDRGLSLLLVEQNVRATLELVDELYLLERGRLVAKGAPAAMKDDPRILDAYLGSLKT
ncbi:ABC transporter ATP-binding protein [Enhydrobacter sp.]|jgi:branched-chain amino acid transport system ATP-binding protein|uniref:ABC transporter ATP-binding protein n=1 Tax=Enhydrobacter sp. TaxID=1894999 RepID=UPI002601A2EB|nr:ABC transporter ATP-binding protein [Enhydrobacter sp.]WIM10119.1 MAG: branched-chain amino acid transport ATP-binding protein LivF [Enhydrobacter sp.]